jgi:hypothetical protein
MVAPAKAITFSGLAAVVITAAACSTDCHLQPVAPTGVPPGSTMGRPVVYIASPYSKGDPAINTHFQCEIWNRLVDDGVVWPVAPLWSHFQHTLYPRKYEDWVAYDMALIPRYDACLRLKAEYSRMEYTEERSTGADNEVAEFKRLGKPVFYSIEELYVWAKHTKQ